MNNEIQFLLYNLPDEEGKVQVVIKDETIWCTKPWHSFLELEFLQLAST